MTNWRTEKPT